MKTFIYTYFLIDKTPNESIFFKIFSLKQNSNIKNSIKVMIRN
jgi:hypothetical protein